MEGRVLQSPEREGEAEAFGRRRDLGLLALLIVAAVGIRGWLLCHTEVAARDSIGYIRYALDFEKKGWQKALQGNHQHPGYPLTVLVASWPVRTLSTAPEADVMQLSAQLATALAAVLLVIPMYYIGKFYFHRPTGFWAALVFQCLPVSGHVLSDGLSEGLFLLLTAVALLLASRAVAGSSPRLFAWCGAFCGLAYVTRPEGALVLVATLLVLVGMQLLPAWRRPWRQAVGCGTALVLPALALGSPYFLTVGGFTTKPSVNQVIGAEGPSRAGADQPQRGEPLGALRPAAVVPAVSLDLDSVPFRRLLQGLWGLGAELVNAFHYVAWIPALLGIWWVRRRVWDKPGTCVVTVFCILHALILWRLAVIVGYLSDRHVQVLVLCGIYPAVTFVWELPSSLRSWLRGKGAPAAAPSGGMAVLSVALLLALIGVGLPKTLHTLHAKRAGYHAAGVWLAAHADPSDVIMDRHMWAHYYSGRVFLEDRPIPIPPGHRPVCYHVVGKGKEREQDPTFPLLFLNEEQVRIRGGTPVYHWPANRALDRATVVVYVMPRGCGTP